MSRAYKNYQPLSHCKALMQKMIGLEIKDVYKPYYGEIDDEFGLKDKLFQMKAYSILVIEFATGLIVSFIGDESIGSIVVRIEQLEDGSLMNNADEDEDDAFLFKMPHNRLSANNKVYSNEKIAKILGNNIKNYRIYRMFDNHPPNDGQFALEFQFENGYNVVLTLESDFVFKNDLKEDYWQQVKEIYEFEEFPESRFPDYKFGE